MSCHVSEKWKNGPVAAQRATNIEATTKALALPTHRVTLFAKTSENLRIFSPFVNLKWFFIYDRQRQIVFNL